MSYFILFLIYFAMFGFYKLININIKEYLIQEKYSN